MKKAFLTANKQQAAPLHEIAFHEEEVWQSSLQLADLGYWDWDFETNTLRYSPAFRILIGGPTRPPLSTFSALLQIVHQDDRAPLTLLLDRTYWGEEERLVSNHGHEFRVVWPDGSIHWLELRGNLFLDTAGRPIQAHGICLNIDSRKQGERIQQSGTEWLRTALDAARNGTWEWNIFTNTITWSDQVEPL
ncbi:MAG TPA: PAS domain-containing protein, partial [Chthonomonadaceae bacterium]|nr:PAS domain-containing protein [Chthonomonadaceae bacterium]